MSGIADLGTLVASLRPQLADGEYVFLTRPGGSYGDGAAMAPIAAFTEAEGLTLVVPKENADRFEESYCDVFRQITLGVHSSLNAVGLTAVVSSKLAEQGIAANVVAAFHHDHVFVPVDSAAEAVKALCRLAAAESKQMNRTDDLS